MGAILKNGIHTVYILSISENATTISQSRLTTSIVILCAISFLRAAQLIPEITLRVKQTKIGL